MGQMSQQLANSSLVPINIPTPPLSFEVSASIVWINALWFLSLVLSLAAALFGMISKQWLREYQQWTTMSGLSETQVALRQGRYEAFVEWKTPAVIASMPVLLELALIFFLLGMEILLWTLNAVVFGICTVAVVILITLVTVVTVLPAFHARCPYKSPVGWTCVLAKAALSPLWNRFMDCIQGLEWAWTRLKFSLRGRGSELETKYGVPWDPCPEEKYCSFNAKTYYISRAVAKDWRERDLALQTTKNNGSEDEKDAAVVVRHQTLIRSLWWIRENSQDQRLMRAVHECIATFAASISHNAFGALAADFNFACEHLHIDPTKLMPSKDQCAVVAEGECVIDEVDLWSWNFGYCVRQAGNHQRPVRDLCVDAPPSARVWIAHLLLSDLLAVVAHYNEDDVRRFGRQADYFLQASALLSGYLAWNTVGDERRPSVVTDRLVELVEHLCRNHARLKPRLKPLLPLLLTFLEGCDGWLPHPLKFPSAGSLPRTHYALTTPPGHPDNWAKADCALFTRIFQYSLLEWRKKRDLAATKALLPLLLSQMTACVRRCHRQQWRDGAVPSRSSLSLWQLSALFDPGYHNFSGSHLSDDQFPHDLIDALQQYSDAQLISYSGDSARIEALTQRSAALKVRSSAQAEDSAVHAGSRANISSSVHDLSPAACSSQLSAHPCAHAQLSLVGALQPADAIIEGQHYSSFPILPSIPPVHGFDLAAPDMHSNDFVVYESSDTLPCGIEPTKEDASASAIETSKADRASCIVGSGLTSAALRVPSPLRASQSSCQPQPASITHPASSPEHVDLKTALLSIPFEPNRISGGRERAIGELLGHTVRFL